MTILLHHVGSLGDSIVTIPALRAVRAEWPSARLVLLHDVEHTSRPERAPASAVFGATGLVDECLPYARDLRGAALAREALRIWWTIRRLAPAAAIFLGPSQRAPSAIRRDAAMYRSAGVPRLIGFHVCPAGSSTGPVDRGAPHEAVRKLERLQRDGIARARTLDWFALPLLPPDPAATAAVDAWLSAHDASARRLVAVAPETLMTSKLWPAARFVELGRRIVAEGWCPVLVGTGHGDGAAADWVVQWGGGLDAAGKWTVPQSTALLERCAAYVGVDSGVAHLAAAVGCPTVVLTSGRADLGQWDPLGDGHVVLRHRTTCEGCAAVTCAVDGHPCMTGLSVDAAFSALVSVLADASARQPGMPTQRVAAPPSS